MCNVLPFCNNPEVCKSTLMTDTSKNTPKHAKGENLLHYRRASVAREVVCMSRNLPVWVYVGVELHQRTAATGTHLLLHQLQSGSAEMAASAVALFSHAAGRG